MVKKNSTNIFIIIIVIILFCANCASTRPSAEGIELQRELNAARLELAVITEYARQLEGSNERAIEIIRRSEQRLSDFEAEYAAITESSWDILDRIERRQRRIELLVIELWRDNQELRSALGDYYRQNE